MSSLMLHASGPSGHDTIIQAVCPRNSQPSTFDVEGLGPNPTGSLQTTLYCGRPFIILPDCYLTTFHEGSRERQSILATFCMR